MTEPLSRVEFTVLGLPQPQGSKTTVVRKNRRPVMREDNPLTEPWRATVAARAQAVMHARPIRTGPLRMRVVFVFPRPASHFGTGRNEGRLKASAPVYCRTRPDVDKLLRAIGDALTGVVWRDDAQVVIVQAEKHYGQPPCAHIIVEELALEDDRALETAGKPASVPADRVRSSTRPGGPRRSTTGTATLKGANLRTETETVEPVAEPEPPDEPEPDEPDTDDDEAEQ